MGSSPLISAADAAGLGGIIQDGLLGITFVQNAINGAVNTDLVRHGCIPNAVFLRTRLCARPRDRSRVPFQLRGAAAGLARTVTPVGTGGASLTAVWARRPRSWPVRSRPGWSTCRP